MRRVLLGLVGAVTAAAAACAAAAPAPEAVAEVPAVRPVVLGSVPHDTSAFSEGLELSPDDPTLVYESTGLAGRSQLREIDAGTGAVRRAVPLPGDDFGEGLTVVGPTIWQLTWQDGVALEWDRATLTLRRQVPIRGEGWGLCSEGNRLVRSDGTDRLRFHDPATFAETGSVAVTLDGRPVTRINELECVGGAVWANVWQTDRLVRIDPATGVVTAVVDASGLLTAAQRPGTDVLNGIAHLTGNEFLLTGKFWPASFRVQLP
ncbi:glutaminyl-peptide cyclotransferase [Pseudonocardia ailaonensis]|uniref:Glutaminyl-peptide cyclotransferase n=1 Tax=Pseudonocardia ailaonensis TaxID=367279 RepID=A0ABN2NGG9_9PSEU